MNLCWSYVQEKIDNDLSQNVEAYAEISPNDPVGKYHGPEHSGRVRGLGLGAVPTVAFKHTTTRLSGMNFGSSGAGSSSTYLEKKVENLQSQMQALMAFVCSNQGGNVPQELSAFFTNSTQQVSMENLFYLFYYVGTFFTSNLLCFLDFYLKTVSERTFL